MSEARENFNKRKARVRTQLRKKSAGKLRLSVFRSNKHIYAQIIDDIKGVTIVSASTQSEQLAKKAKGVSNIDAAKKVGEMLAQEAIKAKVASVVFDRGGYLYHGRVKALAEAAREAGLKF